MNNNGMTAAAATRVGSPELDNLLSRNRAAVNWKQLKAREINPTPLSSEFPKKKHLHTHTHTHAGFFVGGPFLAAILAVAANYGSKQENDAGEAVRGISANAIEAFNFLTTLNSKYDVTGE